MIPEEAAQNFAKTDFTKYFPDPRTGNEKGLQVASEMAGSLSPLGKMFSMLKGGAELARVPKALQNASALTSVGAIATPGDVGDKALGAVGALSLGGAGKLAEKVGTAASNKIPAFLRGLTNDSTAESLVNSVQKSHDELSKTADQLYGYVKGAIKKRNISIPVKPSYIKEAADILPKTRATKKLIEDATTGDYDAVHDLQSHLYKKGTKGLASSDISIENQGEEILDLRNRINDDMQGHLIRSGNVDIAHVLKQGKDIYKQLMDTYFNKNLPKSIGKLVHPELRLTPEKPEKLFKQNSKPMNKFLEKHPEAVKHIQGIKEKQEATEALSKIFTNTAKVGGAAYLGKSLFDFLQ
jgi:hypothetical protein